MMIRKLFQDRVEAGRRLAVRLEAYRDASPIVLGLPRGGVPVAAEVARALGAPLDVCVVRKIGAPLHPELAIGAVGENGSMYVDRDLVRRLGVPERELAELVATRRLEVDERVRRFRAGAPVPDVRGRTVIVIDDGIATGATVRAALQTLRARGAGRIVLAVPVGAASSIEELTPEADEVVCLHAEDPLYAVGLWYEDFTATTDDEVAALLERAHAAQAVPEAHARVRSEVVPAMREREIRIPVPQGQLGATLVVPAEARGLVLFAHGSGSSRHSPRNQYVAGVLQRERIATLLLDLLTEEEEAIDAYTRHLRFDIGLLATRLVLATDWARTQAETRALEIGYFGASTGAAAALVAAAERPHVVHAVVSRGGRPDLAEAALGRVRAPTLLLVGGFDEEVLALNRQALAALACDKSLEVVPGATHLFEEPGTLEEVARSAARWFVDHLGVQAGRAAG